MIVDGGLSIRPKSKKEEKRKRPSLVSTDRAVDAKVIGVAGTNARGARSMVGALQDEDEKEIK